MSEKLLRLFLSELTTIRIINQSPLCGAVTEIAVEQLGKAFRQAACPVCGNPFSQQTGDPSPFGPLADAIQKLNALESQVKVQFVIPAEE